jgi:hypothetical protein
MRRIVKLGGFVVVGALLGGLVSLVAFIMAAQALWIHGADLPTVSIHAGDLAGEFTQVHVVVDNPGDADDSEYDLPASHEAELPRMGGTTTIYITLRATVALENRQGTAKVSELVPVATLDDYVARGDYTVAYSVYEGRVTPQNEATFVGTPYSPEGSVSVSDGEEVTVVAELAKTIPSTSVTTEERSKKTVRALTDGISTTNPGFTFLGWRGSDGFLYDDGDANADGKSLDTEFEGSLDSAVSGDIAFAAEWRQS